MRIDFLDPAETEFIEAIAHYNLQSEGLGYEFAAEIKRAMERILRYPEAWDPLSGVFAVAGQAGFRMALSIKSEMIPS